MPGKRVEDVATFLAFGIAKQATRDLEALKLVAVPVSSIRASIVHEPVPETAPLAMPAEPDHPEESVHVCELPMARAEWAKAAQVPFRAGHLGPVQLPFAAAGPPAHPGAGHVLIPRNAIVSITSGASDGKPEQTEFLKRKTIEEVQQGSVEQVTDWTKVRVILPVFVAVHPVTNKLRVIYDGRALNLLLLDATGAVKYESLRDALLLRARVATKLDLQAAFRHVAIAEHHREYFGFVVDGRVYRYTCLPFGSNWSPALYARLLQPAIDQIRKLGIKVIWYVDDILVVSNSREELDAALVRVMQILAQHGWKIAADKTFCHAYTTIPFLGLLVSLSGDGNSSSLSIPRAKRDRTVAELQDMLRCNYASVHTLQKVTGRLQFLAVVLPELGCSRSSFDGAVAAGLRQSSRSVPIIGRLREDATAILALLQEDAVLQRTASSADGLSLRRLMVYSDASAFGWGVLVIDARGRYQGPPGSTTAKGWSKTGTFTPPEIAESSAAREILAIYYSIIALDLKGVHVCWHSDSTCAVAAIHRWASSATGVASALTLLFGEVQRRGIRIDMVHVRRELEHMPIADWLSRRGWRDRQAEWAFSTSDCQRVCASLGLPCNGDLFASERNKQFPFFCSRFLEGNSRGDAMYVSWWDRVWWAFPPLSLRARVLQRLVHCLSLSRAVVDRKDRRRTISMILVITPVSPADPDSSLWAELAPVVIRSVTLHSLTVHPDPLPSRSASRTPLLPNLRLIGDHQRPAPRPPPWPLVAHRIHITADNLGDVL